MSKLNNVARWCFRRIRRTCLFLSFLMVISFLVIFAFVTLNQNHAHLDGIKAHLQGGRGLGPHTHDVWSITKGILPLHRKDVTQVPRQRPMVQFYPDNQNRYLYRKIDESIENNEVIMDPPLNIVDSVQTVHKLTETNNVTLHAANTTTVYNSANDVIVPCSKVHAFYYAWYGNPSFDETWQHWNHEYMANWDKKDKRKMPTGKHNPENLDIGASFYPELGAYSSRDPKVIAKHMKMLRQSQVGVFVLSWYPPGLNDPHGNTIDELVPVLLDAAELEGLKMAFHIEPYAGRGPLSLRENLSYIHESYGKHPAFYKVKGKPFYYVYDSYLTTAKEWSRLLKPGGDLSVRGTSLDAFFIGLVVDYKHRTQLKSAGFDGFYTYFGANGFSYGSTWKNWRSLSIFARRNSLIFIPSVAPGYDDMRVRPWNGENTRLRRKGAYYDIAWRTFLELGLQYVSITSFNEWHEGTQIEPAVPKDITGYSYSSYIPSNPSFYLEKTRDWIQSFIKSSP